MEDLYIDIRNENSIITSALGNKDLVSIDEILGTIEDMSMEIDRLKEQIEDREQEIADNYRRIPVAEQVGISERDFI